MKAGRTSESNETSRTTRAGAQHSSATAQQHNGTTAQALSCQEAWGAQTPQAFSRRLVQAGRLVDSDWGLRLEEKEHKKDDRGGDGMGR